MRKHDVRKWLHAVLDLLPVILIPVFMIYSHRHTIDSGSIDVPQNQVVDFNQQIKNPDFENLNYWDNFSSTYTEISINNGCLTSVVNDGSSSSYNYGIYSNEITYVISHIYYVKFDVITNGFTSIGLDEIPNSSFTFVSGVSSIYNFRFTYLSYYSAHNLFINPTSTPQVGYSYTISNVGVFDLTQMFGSGNEPSIEQFNQFFFDNYYDYTLSKKVLLKGTSTITYQDTDIMSQVVYQLYNSVDKYFNMGNVFNMTGVYDWFNLNIFNGNAPISIYIVWNIVLYEFVMDLLFLLYGLFMWFIDMVEKIMDKPFKSIK